MTHPHPATIITGWLVLLLAAAAGDGWWLAFFTLLAAVLACVWAGPRFYRLLKRSRWLLMAMLLSFALLTPGEPLFPRLGVTYEGLRLALEGVSRLLLALASLALALNLLSPMELVTGIRSLLAPLEAIGPSMKLRDRLAVRLALTLSEIERAHQRKAACADENQLIATLYLPLIPYRRVDYLIGLSAGLAAVLFSLRFLA